MIVINDAEHFKEEVLGNPSSTTTDSAAASSTMSKSSSGKINVVDLFKLPKDLKEIFGFIRGEYGETLKAKEVKDLLAMFIRNKGFESDGDDKSVLKISTSEKIYKSIKDVASPILETSALWTPPLPPKPSRELEESECSDESESWSDANRAVIPKIPSIADYDNMSGWCSTNSVGGLKIHKDGLKSVEELKGLPPPVEAAKKIWKPVDLPSGAMSSNKSSSSGITSSEEFPSLAKDNNAAPKMASKGDLGPSNASKGDHPPTEARLGSTEFVTISKEQFVKAILGKMIGYHAIIQSDGAVNIHSGGVPKVKIIVEIRRGNKVNPPPLLFHDLTYLKLTISISRLCFSR